MELGIVAAMGYWGYRTGQSSLSKMVLAVVAPVVVFGFWGLVDFHQAGRFAEPIRLVQELALSLLAAAALYFVGQSGLAWILVAVSAVHHVLVYALGERLLKHQPLHHIG